MYRLSIEAEKSKGSKPGFFDFFQPSSVYFGWVPYDENGEVGFPENPNGSGYGFGERHIEHIVSIDEYELE
ncbi:hypothetical protein ACJ2A9_21685 [Anaerobacillus sp. MEB173]|uniref:hypothetical protein n=1 Tax=Anaerobacillus sp. MEB173 TaxID=3383345 RepID=UPI003F90C526